jgi:hypothetical protein
VCKGFFIRFKCARGSLLALSVQGVLY